MHRILLDTCLYLWWLNDDANLSKKARELITEAEEIYISSVSLWEAAIKVQLKKLHVNMHELVHSIKTEGFIELPLRAEHSLQLLHLPQYHRDPFDRILIAQAICEPLKFLTADKTLKNYSELIEVV